jgi:hypothetical protein
MQKNIFINFVFTSDHNICRIIEKKNLQAYG